MSTLIRKLVFGLIGLLGGLAAWPLSEVVLANQAVFPSFLIFTVCLGAVFGAIVGAFLGSSEGITISVKPNRTCCQYFETIINSDLFMIPDKIRVETKMFIYFFKSEN